MSDDEKIISFGAKRFLQSDKPRDTKIEDCFDAAREFVRENGSDHVIICIGRDHEDGGSLTKWFQAGNFRYHSMMGLLFEVGHMIRESD